MILEFIKQNNPEHIYYIPFLNPLKSELIFSQRQVCLVRFYLPKGAVVLIDSQGREGIYINNILYFSFTDIVTGYLYLMDGVGDSIQLKKAKKYEHEKVIEFPERTNIVKNDCIIYL